MRRIVTARKNDRLPIRVDKSMTLWPLIGSDSECGLDCVVTDIDGLHSRRINHRSSKLYYVKMGVLRIKTDDGESQLGIDDVGVVPAGVACSLVGEQAQVVIVCTPPFNPNDEEIDL